MTADFQIYDSISQASGATGIPDRVFRRAKKEGCPAFKGSRVVFGDFLTWYFTRNQKDDPDERLHQAKATIAEERAKQEKVNTAKAQESVVSKNEARRAVTRYAIGLRLKLQELPKRLAFPLSLVREPVEIEMKITEEVRAVLAQMFKFEWGEIKCPHCKKEIKE